MAKRRRAPKRPPRPEGAATSKKVSKTRAGTSKTGTKASASRSSNTRSRNASAFTKLRRQLREANAFEDDDQLDFAIHQDRLYGRTPEPLTVRAIIRQMEKVCRTTNTVSNAERKFLAEFAAASDRGAFIEDCFLRAAVEGGNTLKTYTHRREDVDEDHVDEETGWVGLHRFFGMYVVNCTRYGEGQDDYGPFARRKDAKTAFDVAISFEM